MPNKHTKSNESEVLARKILLGIGLRRPIAPNRHTRNLVSKFGSAAEDALLEIEKRAAGETGARIYAKKNVDPDLSLAIASQGFFPIYESFLAWLIREFPVPPQRVLDLGCEAGVMSVAMAKLWPETEFVGLDREPMAIEVANALKMKNGAHNCDFLVAQIEDVADLDLGEFDLAIALAVFHEILGYERRKQDVEEILGFSIGETARWEHGRQEMLAGLTESLASNGVLVAANRWTTPERVLQWTWAMEEAGWATNLARSYLLEVHDRHTGDEVLPLTVHSVDPEPVQTLPDDILALYVYPDFRDHERFSFEEHAAEAMYRSLGPRERIVGFELTYGDGSGTERMELFAAGSAAYLYNSSSRGYRRLLLGSLAFVLEFAGSVLEFAETRRDVGELRPLGPEGDVRRWAKYGITINEAALPV